MESSSSASSLPDLELVDFEAAKAPQVATHAFKLKSETREPEPASIWDDEAQWPLGISSLSFQQWPLHAI